eukprot:gene6166-561_t
MEEVPGGSQKFPALSAFTVRDGAAWLSGMSLYGESARSLVYDRARRLVISASSVIESLTDTTMIPPTMNGALAAIDVSDPASPVRMPLAQDG